MKKTNIKSLRIFFIYLAVLISTYIVSILFLDVVLRFLPGTLFDIFYNESNIQELQGIELYFIIIIFSFLLFAFICGLTLYLLFRRIKHLFLGFFLFILIFIIFSALIYCIVGVYNEYEYNKVLTKVEEVVGNEKIIFTYVDSVPDYDENNQLREINVTFQIIAPKTGDYGVYSTLYSPEDPYGHNIDTYSKTNMTFEEGVSYDKSFTFDMAPFVENEYEGILYLDFSVDRINIQIENVSWSTNPITWRNVNIIDSGQSPNYEISTDTGVESPVYSIGPFSIYKE
ncbi:MAG: hypothetical protein PHW73_11620 [Atribacterota bacterium]|nr:hypothetical protein [Atribacterota bacterium]